MNWPTPWTANMSRVLLWHMREIMGKCAMPIVDFMRPNTHNAPMQMLALSILIAAALWCVGVGTLMAARPRRFLAYLGMTASTRRINTVEQSLRSVAGLAMTVRAESSKLPILFELGGWFVVATSLALLIIPLRWHAAYAIWWSKRLAPIVVQAIAPLAIAIGPALIYAAC